MMSKSMLLVIKNRSVHEDSRKKMHSHYPHFKLISDVIVLIFLPAVVPCSSVQHVDINSKTRLFADLNAYICFGVFAVKDDKTQVLLYGDL